MSDFLEEVFAAQSAQPTRRRRGRRRPSPGLQGRRYAVLVTIMVSLTAVPTWIMLRAGVSGIDQPIAATVQPVLPQEPPAASNAPDPPDNERRWVAPVLPPELAPPPPARSEPPAPVLERRSVVDTGSRPVQQKSRQPKAKATTRPPTPPTAEPVPATKPPSQSTSPKVPATGPKPSVKVSGMPVPPEPVKPPRLAERPVVERPEPPVIEKPRLDYPDNVWRARS